MYTATYAAYAIRGHVQTFLKTKSKGAAILGSAHRTGELRIKLPFPMGQKTDCPKGHEKVYTLQMT